MAENVKQNEKQNCNDFSLENIVTTALQIPGIKVNRNQLIADYFKNQKDVSVEEVLTKGPIEAGCSRETLSKIADRIIFDRTAMSSVASFVAGIPGGLAMAATIPADMLQFFGMTIRLAQELTYVYGAPDLWSDGSLDDERVKGQLILYCGVMFGVSSAVASVRFISSQMAKQILRKLPQKALTKTIWYPIVKKIGTAIGLKVTKDTVAKGLSKVVPFIGGVISGGLNFATMMPMGKRLAETLDEANFNYDEQKAEKDFETINTVAEAVDEYDELVDAENSNDNIIDNNIENVNTDIDCESGKSYTDKEKAEENADDSFQDCGEKDIKVKSENAEESKDNGNGFFGFFQKVGSDIGNGFTSMFNQNKNDDKNSDIKSSEDKE